MLTTYPSASTVLILQQRATLLTVTSQEDVHIPLAPTEAALSLMRRRSQVGTNATTPTERLVFYDLADAVPHKVDESECPYVPSTVTVAFSTSKPLPRPSLSVIVRTQGQRMASLERSLTCLAAQSNPDLEVVLVAATKSEGTVRAIQDFVRHAWWEGHLTVHIVWCPSAGRTAPLNAGLLASQGRYVGFLDDDDYVTSEWADAFLSAIPDEPVVLRQRVLVARLDGRGDSESELPRVRDWDEKYCIDWNLFQHLYENHTPIMGFALPSPILHDVPGMFDERLHVAEDWDLLMRSVAALGIQDVRVCGGVYCLRDNANSRGIDLEEQWAASFVAVRSKLNEQPPALQTGWLEQLDAFSRGVAHSRSQPTSGTTTEEALQSRIRALEAQCQDTMKARAEIESLLLATERARLDTERALKQAEQARLDTDLALRKALKRSPLFRAKLLWDALTN